MTAWVTLLNLLLAEYEARAATVQAMQSAVSAQLQTMPTLCEALYIQRVEPRTSCPMRYSRLTDRPSILASTTYSGLTPASRTRASNSRSSSKENASCKLSILTAWVTLLNLLLAEYEARAATVQAMQSAVSAQLQTMPTLCEALYIQRGELVQLDTARANAAEVQLTAAVQQSLAALPKTDYLIPFGSLTNNSLLSGLGPGWEFTLQPQGYVQGAVRETAESLSINTTRCTAVLELTVTVNMVLDGRTATLTVTDTVPLASVLICGDTPGAYASNFD